jgi:3-hydroxyacyl-[acyl-carrier-protein] dehydratase
VSDPARIELNLGAEEIARLIPHRAPLALVSRVVAFSPTGPTLWAERAVAVDEPVFAGHFPGQAIWPGAYTIEGLAQCAALLLAWSARSVPESLTAPAPSASPLLASVEIKLIKPVHAGDRIDYEVEVTHRVGELVRLRVAARVAGREVARGSLTVASSG